MTCSLAPLKCVLFVINVLLWLLGAFFVYIGITYLMVNSGSLSYYALWPVIPVFSCASILILGGFVGCIGTIYEKKSFLAVFLVLLLLVLACEVAVSVLMLSQKIDVKRSFDDFVQDQFNSYANHSSDFNSTSFVDESQKNLKCCGFKNYTDWLHTTWYSSHSQVPQSCCKPQNNLSNHTSTNCTGDISKTDVIYTLGCEDQINSIFYKVYDAVAWSSLALAILLLIGMIIVIALLVYQRNLPLGYTHLTPGYTEA